MDYNNEKTLPGIHCFIYKHLQNLNKTIDHIKYTKVIISTKSQFYKNNMGIIRFIYKANNQVLSSLKVIKILK